tara:strand:+ start:397 stop:615 length:219 start_codon:yes stop_codon:yes gene_type:complete
MIESVVALLLFLKGDIIEATYKDKMSDCLRSKRLAQREVNPNNVKFTCKQIKAETEIYMGAKKIVKIISLSK